MNKRGNKKARMGVLASAWIVAALLSGCGGHPYYEADTAGNIPGSSTGGNNNGGNSGGGTTDPNLLPAYTQSFSFTGAQSFSTTVNTDNTLKIRIKARGTTSNNYAAHYNCVAYTVTVLGQTVTTSVLAADGGGAACPNAPTQQEIDFSSRLTPGHGTVTVTISAAGTDAFYQQCVMNPWLYGPCQSYYPIRAVYSTHVVAGAVDIGVNGTSF